MNYTDVSKTSIDINKKHGTETKNNTFNWCKWLYKTIKKANTGFTSCAKLVTSVNKEYTHF